MLVSFDQIRFVIISDVLSFSFFFFFYLKLYAAPTYIRVCN